MDRRFMFIRKICPLGFVCPCPGAIYIVYDDNIQTSTLKPHGQSEPNFIWSILRAHEVYINDVNDPGHMTKMAAMPIYSRNRRIGHLCKSAIFVRAPVQTFPTGFTIKCVSIRATSRYNRHRPVFSSPIDHRKTATSLPEQNSNYPLCH